MAAETGRATGTARATGSSLARQLTEVSGEKTLVLPIQAGRQQEFVAVEIRPHPHLDALEEFHQYEARLQRLGTREFVEHGAYIPAVGQAPHIVVDRSIGTVELQDIAGGIFLQEVQRRRPIGEFPIAGD